MQEKLKTIEEIFGDYKKDNKIIKSKIEKINLFKKANKLEIDLKPCEYIEIKELLEFEEYLKSRFFIENIEIDTNYDDNIKFPSIESTWNDIVKYMSIKYPLVRVLLHNSKIEIQENVVKVTIYVNGVEFLEARGFDKILQNILKTLYGKTYKIKYVEEIREEEIQK